ncbi:hypothetical protein L596_013384 [Steinernema carpocapsae]|uniref:Secreted protein n=1 Tax=Steinernema carpocapsae TaxID=34508 RepID=A0A4U5NZZ1_STECR|nr:hypothetical protein L596_013384 [Steinernema carpocapsae]
MCQLVSCCKMLTFNRMTLLLGIIAFATYIQSTLADSPPLITIAPTSPIRCGQNEVFSRCGGCTELARTLIRFVLPFVLLNVSAAKVTSETVMVNVFLGGTALSLSHK